MAILSDSEINELLLKTPPLISEFIDLEWQLQPAGFDMTVASVFRVVGQGTIRNTADNTKELESPNLRARLEEISCDREDLFSLVSGSYVVGFNEVLCLPNDVLGIAFGRSTLIRYGASLISGLWDPGFRGKSKCGLVVHNSSGIRVGKNTSLLQMTFHRLTGTSQGFQFNRFYEDRT